MMTTTTTKIRCVYINWYGMAWHDLVLYGMVYIYLPTHLPVYLPACLPTYLLTYLTYLPN